MVDIKDLEKKCQAAFQKALTTKTVQACVEWNRLEDEYDIQLKLRTSAECKSNSGISGNSNDGNLLPKEKG